MADDRRYAGQALVEHADLVPHAVIAEQFPVIGEKHDERVLGPAGFLEHVEDAADGIIHVAHLTHVCRPRTLDLLSHPWPLEPGS